MTVNFEIDIPGGATITEAEIDHNLELLAGMEGPEGGLVFSNTSSGESTAIGDTLNALVRAFCFESIASLVAGKEYSKTLFAYPEKVLMKPEGNEIAVSGDEINTSRYPKKELLEALVACGERYAAYLRKLHANEADWTGRLETIESAAKTARAQLIF